MSRRGAAAPGSPPAQAATRNERTVTVAGRHAARNRIVEADELMDRAIVGFYIVSNPAVHCCDSSWLVTPRWRDALHALRAHLAAGGRLGDIVVAGTVLADRARGVYGPLTAAAEAVCAAVEAAPASWLVERARERRIRLELHRIARLLDEFADGSELATMPRVVEVVARHLDQVRDDLARVLA